MPEENRPYHDKTLLEFRLAEGMEVPDTTGESGGAARGTNHRGQVLPPIIFPKVAIDTTGGTKVQGALKRALVVPRDGSSESEGDSDEDLENDDTDKLRQISHAARLGQLVTVVIRGDYQFDGCEEEVLFQKEFIGWPAPVHILDLLQTIPKSIEIASAHYQGSSLPRSCLWTSAGATRDQMAIRVQKLSRGIRIIYGYTEARGRSI
jgi:hypothetical protein